MGDLTAGWADRPAAHRDDGADVVSDRTAGDRHVALAPIEGVPVVADRRILDVLRTAGPTLRLGGPVFARHLAVRLERPEAWLDFLGTPAAIARQ